MFEVSLIKQVKIDMTFDIDKNRKSYESLKLFLKNNSGKAGNELNMYEGKNNIFIIEGSLTGGNVEEFITIVRGLVQ